MDQKTGSKLGKEYTKAAYCHHAYLTYIQSTSCEMVAWLKHKLKSRLLGEMSMTSDTKWHHHYGRKQRATKELLVESERGSKKAGLKLSIQKMKIIVSGPITSWKIGNNGNGDRLYFFRLQNHCRVVTVNMKLKDACSLEEKLWHT